MNYVAEFAMVETHCPVGSRIAPEACTPLCPDRAVSTHTHNHTHTHTSKHTHLLPDTALPLKLTYTDTHHTHRQRN